MKKKVLTIVAIASISLLCYHYSTGNSTGEIQNDLFQANLEALAGGPPATDGHQPTAITCQREPKSMCIVFDGNGIYIDSYRNRSERK